MIKAPIVMGSTSERLRERGCVFVLCVWRVCGFRVVAGVGVEPQPRVMCNCKPSKRKLNDFTGFKLNVVFGSKP